MMGIAACSAGIPDNLKHKLELESPLLDCFRTKIIRDFQEGIREREVVDWSVSEVRAGGRWALKDSTNQST